MATKYNSNVCPTASNQKDKGGFIIVTAILDEGEWTYKDEETVLANGVLNSAPNFVWATPTSKLDKEDLITIEIDTACTYDVCEGKLVVKKPSSAVGVHGYILSEPVVNTRLQTLSATTANLAARLAGKYYRTAQVVIFANMAKRIAANGTSPIAVLTPITYDVSAGSVIGGSTGDVKTGHYTAADSTYVLALYGLNQMTSQA